MWMSHMDNYVCLCVRLCVKEEEFKKKKREEESGRCTIAYIGFQLRSNNLHMAPKWHLSNMYIGICICIKAVQLSGFHFGHPRRK